jgi:Ca2+/H+ antiporter
MDALLFRTRVAVLWVAVAVAMSGLLLLGLFVPGNLEELLAGRVEGDTLNDTLALLFAALVVIPLAIGGVTLLVSDRLNRYLNLVTGLAFGFLGVVAPVMEILDGTFDAHVVMGLTAGALAWLICGISAVELRRPTAPTTEVGRPREKATV